MILVTGATGFLGHSLCSCLIERGRRLRALVRPTSDAAFLEPLGIELALGDLGDPAAVDRAAAGCRAIIHAGGLFRLWGRRDDFFAVNVTGTRNLLDAARRAGVARFVHISSLGVIGKPPPGTITEESACAPQDAYQESKLAAEQLALDAYRQHGLPVVVLRPGAFYGPGSHYGLNRILFGDPLAGRPFRVHGGRHMVMPVYVADVARAAESALTRGQPGAIYNICGPCLTQREAGAVLEQAWGRRIRWIPTPAWAMIALARVWTWLARFTGCEPYYPSDLYSYIFYDWRVSIARARRDLGFEPTPFADGVRATLDWYAESGE